MPLQQKNGPVLNVPDGVVVGVDVGGTKVAAGLVDGNGAILSQTRTPMLANGTGEEGLSAVLLAIDSLAESKASLLDAIAGIGICSPGPLDPHTGVIINPPNLPCWRNFPLASEVSRRYGVPVKVDNDANAAALAEALWGAGRGYKNIFYATIGTGIGTGIVFDGRLYRGRTGAAAEGGHVSIDYRGPRCGCGKPGCIEALAAGPAIARRARARLSEASVHSAILDLAGGQIENVTSEKVAQAYAAGDALATEILGETVDLLALWLGNMVDLLEPDVIILGGGVSTILRPMLGEIHDRLCGYSVNTRAHEIPVIAARYGIDSGIAGGAALSFEATTAAVSSW
jgi:glucokinase